MTKRGANLRERKYRLAAVGILCMVVMTSCGGGGAVKKGVGVRSINTNVGLGIELEAAAPANIVVQSPRRQLEQPKGSTIPPFDFELPKQVKRPCPLAGPFDFPDRETGVEPTGRPKAGQYPWKLDGKVTTGFGVTPVDTFETRTISRVQNDPNIADAFTFDVKQENLFDERQDRGSLTTRYQVVPKPAVRNEQVPNDVGKGLFLQSIEFVGKDTQGREQRTSFTPGSPLSMLAFPVKDGAAIDSRGSDASTLSTLRIVGTVKGKKQVDACGKRVDSWFVDGELTYTYTDSKNGQTQELHSNYDYGVATQYGAMIVFEHVDAPKDEPSVQLEARVGKVPGS
jgi:hypothetical protein